MYTQFEISHFGHITSIMLRNHYVAYERTRFKTWLKYPGKF